MSGSRTPAALQLSAPYLPWSRTEPSWIPLRSACAAYRSCHEERMFGWVAVDEVAIAHDQGLGDNRQSSLGPLYRCNVDYEA